MYRVSKCLWKESFYGMVCYAMLSYPMLWYGMESMVCCEISTLCLEISMLWYDMVYVVNDKHSATVCLLLPVPSHEIKGMQKTHNEQLYKILEQLAHVVLDQFYGDGKDTCISACSLFFAS